MPGTGLGLASMLQIVEQFGERVTAKSVADNSTRFSVCFPLAVPAA